LGKPVREGENSLGGGAAVALPAFRIEPMFE
jgi:hypothetical protein